MRSRRVAGFLGLSLLWGSDWLPGGWLRDEPPLTVFALRFAVAALLLLPWALRARPWSASRQVLLRSALPGLCILCLPELLITISAQQVGPVIALFTLAAVPVFLAIVGRGAIPTAVCGFAGVLFLSRQGVSFTAAQLPWLLCPLAAALLLAWGLVWAERSPAVLPLSASLCLQCALAAGVFGCAARIFESETIDHSTPVIAGIAWIAAAATVGGYLLFYWLLPRCAAARMSMLQWTQILVTTVESAASLRIVPGWESILGAALIVVAVARAFSKGEASHDPVVILQITPE